MATNMEINAYSLKSSQKTISVFGVPLCNSLTENIDNLKDFAYSDVSKELLILRGLILYHVLLFEQGIDEEKIKEIKYHSKRLESLINSLANCQFRDYSAIEKRSKIMLQDDLNSLFVEFVEALRINLPESDAVANVVEQAISKIDIDYILNKVVTHEK